MSIIYLIRHAQASFGTGDYDMLSVLGHEQARVLGQALLAQGRQPVHVVSGDMVRHRETVEGCMDVLGCPRDVRVDAAWNEYDHEQLIAAYRPAWRDKGAMVAELSSAPHPQRAFQMAFAEAVARWMSGDHDDDYLETWSGFRSRVTTAARDLHGTLDTEQTALVFTSGGPIATIVSELFGLDKQRTAQLSWTLANAGVTKLVGGRSGLRLASFNEHAHFEHDPRLITFR